MKIGVLGGTFDPVHVAHIYLAKKYCEMLTLDKVILVPTFIPPHKSADSLASAEQRLAMCELAVCGCPAFEVCGYEIAERGKSYTFKTLKYLKEQYPDDEFYLLMGADMFLTVQDWRRPQEIYRMATLCAAEREQGELSLLKTHATRLEYDGARCIVLTMEPMPLSSTAVRSKIKANADDSGLLDPLVWEFIRQNGLYRL